MRCEFSPRSNHFFKAQKSWLASIHRPFLEPEGIRITKSSTFLITFANNFRSSLTEKISPLQCLWIRRVSFFHEKGPHSLTLTHVLQTGVVTRGVRQAPTMPGAVAMPMDFPWMALALKQTAAMRLGIREQQLTSLNSRQMAAMPTGPGVRPPASLTLVKTAVLVETSRATRHAESKSRATSTT